LIVEENKKNDAVGYKKLISYPYTTTQFSIGDNIVWESNTWLLTTLDSQYDYSVSGRIVETNIDLKWLDSNLVLKSYRACMDNKISSVGFDENKTIFLPSGNVIVRVQANVDTELLKENTRFIINGNAYWITNINNFVDGLLELYMEQVAISDEDDLTPTAEIMILPEDVRSIILDATQIFTVYKYESGVQQSDTFTFSVDSSSLAIPANYTLTTVSGNSFSIKNKVQDTNPVVILCTDNTDATTQVVAIYLGGVW
jgi:hypothetical protein